MIWATVSSRSCSCWLSRASSSSAAKNIINLILVLAIWWCLCVESSIVLSEESVCYECILLTKLLDFALFHFVLQDQTCLLLQVSLDFLLLHSIPYDEKDIFFLVLILEALVDLIKPFSFAAAAKSLQSCPTLCNPTDGSAPGSPIPGILQARTLEWAAISFSNAWK